MSAPTDLPSMVAEIKAKIFANGVGSITAAILQQVLLDTLNVLDAVAASSGVAAAQAAGAFTIFDPVAAELATFPTSLPTTPGTLWWDGGVLARTDGAPPAGAPIPSSSAYAAAVDARLLAYPTTQPTQAGQLWWDGGLLVRS